MLTAIDTAPTPPQETRRIVAVAFRLGTTTHAIAPPARHHDLFPVLTNLGISKEEQFAGTQGFIDDRGRFLSRKAAWVVAKAAKQVPDIDVPNGELHSEHLW